MSNNITIETEKQKNILYESLFERKMDLNQRIFALGPSQPDELDTCCDAHMQRFEMRKIQIDALEDALREIEGLLTIISQIQID